MHKRTRVAERVVIAISSGSIGPASASRRRSAAPERAVRKESRARSVALVRQSARGTAGQPVFPRPTSVVDVDEVVLETTVEDEERLVWVVVDDDVLVELLDVDDDVVLDVVLVDDEVAVDIVVVDEAASVLVVTLDDVELDDVVVEAVDDDDEEDVLVEVGADEEVEVEDDVLVVVVDAGEPEQSRSQVLAVSSPLHRPSPQHTAALSSVQEAPHRVASQPTGLVPPLPQQKRFEGLPLCTPAQSAGQVTQFSPSPASQMPLPQKAPPTQSCGHDAQVSVASQMPLVHAA